MLSRTIALSLSSLDHVEAFEPGRRFASVYSKSVICPFHGVPLSPSYD